MTVAGRRGDPLHTSWSGCAVSSKADFTSGHRSRRRSNATGDSSTTSDPSRIEATRAWLIKAHHDIEATAGLVERKPPLADVALFHVQQAVEKSLRGFLLWHGVPFSKTHDLQELGLACVDLDPSLTPVVRPAAGLTDYAWETRYPGGPEEYPPDETAEAHAQALSVFETVLDRLPPECAPAGGRNAACQ